MQWNNLFALENNITSVLYSGVTKGGKPHDDKNNHTNMKQIRSKRQTNSNDVHRDIWMRR